MSENDWWFLDLALVIVVTGAISFGLFFGVTNVVRIVVAIPLVLFLPGYALVAVLFPDDPSDEYRPFDEERTGLRNPLLVTGGLEVIERFVLSTVCSVFLVPGVALISSATPRGLTPETTLLGVSLLTISLSLVAIVSRYRCPPERRFTPTLSSMVPVYTRSRPDPYDRTNVRPYNVGIALGLALLVATAGLALASPPQHDGFTEFAIETENVTGETDTMYEATYTTGETQELTASITNHEHGERTYTTVLVLERVGDDGDVVEREELDRGSLTLADGDRGYQSLEVTPTIEGEDLRLTLLLYEDEPPTEPTAENAYRTIHLPVVVN
ncbi:DUF1616 domain-containing protein [Natrialbaceae archaeon A-gly3]